MKRSISKLAMVALILTGLAGCKDDPNPCDSTTYLSGSDCLPKTDAGPDVAVFAPDVAAPAADAEATEAAAPAVDTGGSTGASLLGVPCATSGAIAECQGPDTDYCAIQPGKAGYCTKSGCATAADCPTGWTCFDLSKMGITGYPPMCTMP